MGWMHYQGEGVAPDAQKSLAWYRRAAETGDQEAVEAVEIIEAELAAAANATQQVVPEAGAKKTPSADKGAPPPASDQGPDGGRFVISKPAAEASPIVYIDQSSHFVTIENNPPPVSRLVEFIPNAGTFARPRLRGGGFPGGNGGSGSDSDNGDDSLTPDSGETSLSDRAIGPFRPVPLVRPRTQGIRPLTAGPRPRTTGVRPLGARGVSPLGGLRVDRDTNSRDLP